MKLKIEFLICFLLIYQGFQLF